MKSLNAQIKGSLFSKKDASLSSKEEKWSLIKLPAILGAFNAKIRDVHRSLFTKIFNPMMTAASSKSSNVITNVGIKYSDRI